jgi:hypothetical protein
MLVGGARWAVRCGGFQTREIIPPKKEAGEIEGIKFPPAVRGTSKEPPIVGRVAVKA